MFVVRFIWYAFVSLERDRAPLPEALIGYKDALAAMAYFLYYWPLALLFSVVSWAIINWYELPSSSMNKQHK
jgi:hypothetical protein